MPGPVRYDKKGRVKKAVPKLITSKGSRRLTKQEREWTTPPSGQVGRAGLDVYSDANKAKRKARRVAKRTVGSSAYAAESAKRSGTTTKPYRAGAKASGTGKATEKEGFADKVLDAINPIPGASRFVKATTNEVAAKASALVEGDLGRVSERNMVPEGASYSDALDFAAVAGAGVGAAAKGAKAAGGAIKAESAADKVSRIGKIAREGKGKPAARAKRTEGKAARQPPRKARRKVRRTKEKVKLDEFKTVKGAKTASGKVTRNHPVLATGGALAAADAAGIDLPVVNEVGALVEGHARAIVENPIKTVKTTARAVPGMIAGVAAPVAAVGQTIGRAAMTAASAAQDVAPRIPGAPEVKGYSAKEIVSPTVDTAVETAKGTVAMAKPLLSGDAKKVQQSVEDDIGLILLTPTPKAISTVRGSKAYKGTRGAARRSTAARREAKRGKQVRTKRAKDVKLKHTPKDSVDGGEYILRRAGQKIENRRGRIEQSRNVTRAEAQGRREGALAEQAVTKELRQVKTPEGRSKKQYRQSAADALASVAVYSLPRNYARAVEEMNLAEKGLSKPEFAGYGKKAPVTDRQNFKFLKDNPEIFSDPAFWRAVNRYKKEAETIETSQVKKYLATGQTHGVKLPEDRMKEGQMLDGKPVKVKPMTPQTLRKKEAKLRSLFASAKSARKESHRHEPGSPEHFVAIGREQKFTADATKLRDELRLQNRASKMAKDSYVSDVKAVIKDRGLETPAYAKSFEQRSGALISEPRFAQNRMAHVQHKDMDVARRKGTADRSYKATVAGSIYAPRMKRVIHRLTSEFAAKEAIMVTTKTGKRRLLTSTEIRKAVERGDLDPSAVAVFHSQHFKSAVLDPHRDGSLADIVAPTYGRDGMNPINRGRNDNLLEQLDALEADIKKRELDPGKKYIVVNKSAVKEFAHQFDGKDSGLAAANRMTSRVILGYNPSWVAAQLIAEGVPAAIAIGANPARWGRIARALREGKELPNKDRAAVESLAGTTAGIDSIPKPGVDMRGRDLSDNIPVTPGSRGWKEVKSYGKGEGLGRLDRLKGGAIRKAVLAARVDKEFNGFMQGLGGTLKLDDAIRPQLKGKSLAEQQAFLAKHPQTARQLETYLDEVLGNWRAITHLERGPASLVAFYPYVRYSVKTAWWGFPKNHPIKSTILAFLSQQNAEQLEKLVPGGPADWLDYAFPVTFADGEAQVVRAGERFAMGLSAPIQALFTQNPNRMLTGINPAIGVGIQAGLGVEPFTGEQLTSDPLEKGLLGLAAAASMFAPLRIADDLIGSDGTQIGPAKIPPPLTSIKPRKTYDGVVIGGQSDTSKEFDRLDPNKTQRSGINVLASQSAQNYVDQVALERTLEAGDFASLPGSATSDSSSSAAPWYEPDAPSSPSASGSKEWWQK